MTISFHETEESTSFKGIKSRNHTYKVEQGELTRVLQVFVTDDYPDEASVLEATIDTDLIDIAIENSDLDNDTLFSVAFYDDRYFSFRERNFQRLYTNSKGRYINYRGGRLYLP